MANMRLPNQPNEAEVTDFLSIVDKLDDVMKGMNSEDDDEKRKYMSKADDLMKEVEERKKKEKEPIDDEDDDLPKTKTGFSRTSINKNAYANDTPPSQPASRQEEPMDQNAFMAAMEADAQERAARRKERDKKASKLKEQGNEEFKKNNFSKALEFYNQAIEQVKDSIALYTNRAQTNIKLGNFEQAISDCDWALRIAPECMKAMVQKGHSYLGLKDFEKARQSYKEIINVDKGKEEMVKGYISQADRREKALKEEETVSKKMSDGEAGTKTVVGVLNGLGKENQAPIYYSGGLRLLAHLMTDVDSQTLFRTQRGLTKLLEHPVINRCLSSKVPSLNPSEKDLVSSLYDLITSACTNNDANQEEFFNMSAMTQPLMSFLAMSEPGQGQTILGHQVPTSCVNLLHEVSNTENGRDLILKNFDMKRLIVSLLQWLEYPDGTVSKLSASLLNNLALHKKLNSQLRNDIESDILPSLEHVLNQEKLTQSTLTLVSLMATNWSTDKHIRDKLASSTSLWNAICHRLTLSSQSKISMGVESLLGWLANMTLDTKTSPICELGLEAVRPCYALLKSNGISSSTLSRALKVIANILPLCSKSLSFFEQNDKCLVFLQLLQDSNSDLANQKICLKCLAVLTQKESICICLADNKGTSTFVQLLNNKDETIVGNAILCLTHLSAINKVCGKLTKTNIVQKLLVLARDGRNRNLQSNAAILIGKLATGDKRHLQQLRELHGVEILHDCMKYIH